MNCCSHNFKMLLKCNILTRFPKSFLCPGRPCTSQNKVFSSPKELRQVRKLHPSCTSVILKPLMTFMLLMFTLHYFSTMRVSMPRLSSFVPYVVKCCGLPRPSNAILLTARQGCSRVAHAIQCTAVEQV